MLLIEYRSKLVNKILFATSQDEVMHIIDNSIKGLAKNDINDQMISRFIEKIIFDLESFSPMKKEAQQWSNITMARIQFFRIKRELNVISM